jgi:hypothetical protein
MRQASKRIPESAEKTVRDIRRATRRHHSAEEKIRIVLEGLRGEDSAPARNIEISAKIPLRNFSVSANIPTGLDSAELLCGGPLMGIIWQWAASGGHPSSRATSASTRSHSGIGLF